MKASVVTGGRRISRKSTKSQGGFLQLFGAAARARLLALRAFAAFSSD
jgi:hypothetical protein